MQAKLPQPTPRRLAVLVAAALAFGASASCLAAGEAMDNELPSMRTPVQASEGGLTRAQVRAELDAARAGGLLSRNGEAGDTAEVLIARDAFNVAQADTIMAEYRAEHERAIALAEAEVRRSAIESEGLTQSVAVAPDSVTTEGDVAVDFEDSAPGEMPAETIDAPTMQNLGGESAVPSGPGLRIDILDYERSGVGRPEELVIVSLLDDQDETSQLETASAVRSQLAAMGLAQDQIYLESASRHTV